MNDARPQGPAASPGNQMVWMLVSTALLAAWIGWRLGWVWAVAGVVGVFVHEYGHVLAMNAAGCGPARIRIIPFLGGAAIPARPPQSEFKNVLIALAGPSFGLLAALPFYAAAGITGENVWLEGAFFIAVINLFNLLPAPPLDGSHALGPTLARIHPWLERAALVLVGGAVALWALSRHDWIFGLFVALGTFSALKRPQWRAFATPLSGSQWAASLGLYLATAVLAAGVLVYTVALLNFPTGPGEIVRRLGF